MSYSVKSDVWTFGIVSTCPSARDNPCLTLFPNLVSEIVLQNEPHFGENQIEVACNIRQVDQVTSASLHSANNIAGTMASLRDCRVSAIRC